MSLRIAPITQADAKRFIARHHRHNMASIGAVFVVGLRNEDTLVGAAMAGIPKSRMLMDGATLEVTRVCVLPNHRNANSMLYGACARVAAGLGYSRLVTYTLESETSASLKAAGWLRDDCLRTHDPSGWLRNRGHGMTDLFGARPIPNEPKIRWFKQLGRTYGD